MELMKEDWTTHIEIEMKESSKPPFKIEMKENSKPTFKIEMKESSKPSFKIGMIAQLGFFTLAPTADGRFPAGLWALQKEKEKEAMARNFVPELFLPPKLVQLLFLNKTADLSTPKKFELRGEEFTLIRDDVRASEEKQHRIVVALGNTHHLICCSCRTIMVGGLFWNDANAFLTFLELDKDFQLKDQASTELDLIRHATVNENARKLMNIVLDLELRGL